MPPAPGGRRPLWRRALRVDLLLVGVALALLVVGFLLGLAVGGDGDRPAPAPSPPASASTVAPATVTSVITVAGPPPPSCQDAIEAAERAIAYLVANVRDDRLTRAIQEFTAQRRACLRATR